jgi:DNA-binding NarL/FixJ family response regulator
MGQNMNDNLTEREKQVAHYATLGMSNREVGEKLGIEKSTVEQYLYRAYDKLGIHSRRQIIEAAASLPESRK